MEAKMGLSFGDVAIGVSQGTNQAIQTGMNLQAIKSNQMQMENELALQPLRIKQLTSSIEAQETAARKADLELKEYERQRELLPLKETARRFGFKSDKEISYLESLYPGDVEYIQDDPYVQRGTLIKRFDEIKGDPKVNIKIGEIRTEEIKKNISAIDDQLTNQEIAGKLKPEQAQALQARWTA